jgi:hypothetical protein
MVALSDNGELAGIVVEADCLLSIRSTDIHIPPQTGIHREAIGHADVVLSYIAYRASV